MSNFTFFHSIFYAICILKSFNSHIPVAICSFFEFGTVSKWCIREWVKYFNTEPRRTPMSYQPTAQISICPGFNSSRLEPVPKHTPKKDPECPISFGLWVTSLNFTNEQHRTPSEMRKKILIYNTLPAITGTNLHPSQIFPSL